MSSLLWGWAAGRLSRPGAGLIGDLGILDEERENLSSKDITGQDVDLSGFNELAAQVVDVSYGQLCELVLQLATGHVHGLGLGDRVQQEVGGNRALRCVPVILEELLLGLIVD